MKLYESALFGREDIENDDTAQHAITANSSTVAVFCLSKGARKQDTHINKRALSSLANRVDIENDDTARNVIAANSSTDCLCCTAQVLGGALLNRVGRAAA